MFGHYTYLLIDLACIALPLIASFEHRITFYKKWKWLLPAIFISYLFMIVWDHYFTVFGVWGFNHDFLLGIEIWGLPLEEHMFFFCIPYAYMFTYEALKQLVKQDYIGSSSLYISGLLAIGLPIIIYLHFNQLYTALTALCLEFLLIQHMYVFRSHKRYLGRFYFAFVVCLIPFFVLNGILTSLPVVIYNNRENLGIRMGTSPIEDLFYGLFNLLLVVTIYERLAKKRGDGILGIEDDEGEQAEVK